MLRVMTLSLHGAVLVTRLFCLFAIRNFNSQAWADGRG